MRNSPHPYAAVTILFWSLAFVLTRVAMRHFSAFSLGFLRYAVASCILIVVALRLRLSLPRRADLKWFLAAGATGFFIYVSVFNLGCRTIPSSTSSVVIATVPVITALLARFLYSERLTAIQWTAIGIEFLGVAALTVLRGGIDMNVGLLWLLAAAVSISVYNLLQRKLTRTYDGLTTAAFSIFAGTAMLAVFLPASMREVSTASLPQLLIVAVLGIFCSAVAFVAWSQALARAKQTSTVSNYMFATPFLASLLGFLIGGETPDLPTLAGGTVILAGMALFYFGDRIRNRAQSKRKEVPTRHAQDL